MKRNQRPPNAEAPPTLRERWRQFSSRFDDTETGRRRLFFFAVGAANGLLTWSIALVVLRENPRLWWAGLLLWLVGIGFFIFAYRVATGAVTWLVTRGTGLNGIN